ncbi:MAG: beta-propeller domain-containing protein [Nanoarchaeota archaeon]
MKKKGLLNLPVMVILILVAISVVTADFYLGSQKTDYKKFETCGALNAAFEQVQERGDYYGIAESTSKGGATVTGGGGSASADSSQAIAPSYSATNIQVEGVDEADIVKTDGKYIYTLSTGSRYYGYRDDGNSGSVFVIVNAYPAETASVLSETDLGGFYPTEMFINGNYLMIFGSTNEEISMPVPMDPGKAVPGGASSASAIAPEYYPYSTSFMTVKIFDISNKASPEEVRSVDFEGSYVSSRMIGSDVYFVVNSYPRYYAMEDAPEVIVPMYRDLTLMEIKSGVEEDFEETCGCADVGYFEPVQAQNFVTIASIQIDNPNAEIEKQVIVGSGQNIYASQENLYIAETNYPYWGWGVLESGETQTETTNVHKFSLDNSQIDYVGVMEAPGRILNQFSMDEHNGYFRIATTIGEVWNSEKPSSNNVYIFDSGLNQVGSIEDIAPGEQIYSARFMGDREYLVTFKKIDPFFVIDLSNPTNPQILGKLKIPGYSDYMHPYDENHIIGIGKDTAEASESEMRGFDFAWYQGVKIAIFDVTDVSNPIELHKVIIGDRGTDSEVLNTHKAFLFDKEKNLLVLPITLAEIPQSQKTGYTGNAYGEFVYQGAYVYDISIENGFQLKGRITHYENDDTFKKSGSYWYGGDYSVIRSLYIGNTLYTVSNKMIKANSLTDLAEITKLTFGG